MLFSGPGKLDSVVQQTPCILTVWWNFTARLLDVRRDISAQLPIKDCMTTVEGWDFSPHKHVQIGSRAQPVSYPMHTMDSFLKGIGPSAWRQQYLFIDVTDCLPIPSCHSCLANQCPPTTPVCHCITQSFQPSNPWSSCVPPSWLHPFQHLSGPSAILWRCLYHIVLF
jgi:hypothetical protein